MYPIFITGAVAMAVLLLLLPRRYLLGKSRWLQTQFARLGRITIGRAERAGTTPLPAFRWAERLTPGTLVAMADRLFTAKQKERFRQRVLFARLELRLTWRQFLALKLFVPLIGLIYLLLLYLGNGFDIALAVVSPIPVLAFFVPDQWLSGRMKRRQRLIERELPAVLTTLAITVETGLGLGSAIEEVARNQSGVLAAEFRWAAEQVALGMPQGQALEAMAARCGVPDLTMFVSSLVQSFEKGTSQISATLRSQSQDAWAKRRRRAEELAQTASVRLFLPLVLLVFPAILIFLLGPALMTISDFFGSQ